MKNIGYSLLRKGMAAMVFGAVILPALAEGTGVHGDLLKKALAESAKGKCPAEIMSPLLRGACEQQMPGMGQMIANKGSLVGVEFMGTQMSGMGPAEVYRVKFSAGSMMWMINTGGDGKILVLFSPG